MINVAGHLREQNGTYQMALSWKDANGKRRTKSISTGLPVKENKKRAESLLCQTQNEFNPETMQQVGDLSVPEYLTRWLRESVMNLSPDTYGRYAYDMGRSSSGTFQRFSHGLVENDEVPRGNYDLCKLRDRHHAPQIKKKTPPDKLGKFSFLCRWWGSNPHVLLAQGILSFYPHLPSGVIQ